MWEQQAFLHGRPLPNLALIWLLIRSCGTGLGITCDLGIQGSEGRPIGHERHQREAVGDQDRGQRSTLAGAAFTAPEAMTYGLADDVLGRPAEAPESGTPA
jgi:hypothetical protein